MIKITSEKQARAEQKLARIPVKFEPTPHQDRKRLPKWFYRKLPKASEGNHINTVKGLLKKNRLISVCEEASCPNLSECYQNGTATFMIMGENCTRRCAFCDVKHGRPLPLDTDEPLNLAKTIADMNLRYVVITSVDRDDLKDGGAAHFGECILQTRTLNPNITVEVLVPDFRGRMEKALDILAHNPPDVFNHNLETVPRLYLSARPGSDYQVSLTLLSEFKARFPKRLTKSGIMLGLGETNDEILTVLEDLRAHHVDMLTLGQYLQPTQFHLPVDRYVSPEDFAMLGRAAKKMGFTHVASGPLVRSSYHAEHQTQGDLNPLDENNTSP